MFMIVSFIGMCVCYSQGWINEPGAHELRGPLGQSLCVKSLLCISYLWLKKVYFIHLLMALIECTCAVLEKARLMRQ